MTATDPTPDLQADLPDVLRMVAELGTVRPMGLVGRRILLALANAALDVEKFEGLVIDGEVYAMRWRKEWACCKCGDGKHEWRRDAPQARSHWNFTRTDAESEVRQASQQRMSWNPGSPEPHLVSHIVATTSTEEVK
jgi:hypothetical protein